MIEPYTTGKDIKPAWKTVKARADQKNAERLSQEALFEYGELLKHPYMFGEMPLHEKYDVFLSMAKILKRMEFFQKVCVMVVVVVVVLIIVVELK